MFFALLGYGQPVQYVEQVAYVQPVVVQSYGGNQPMQQQPYGQPSYGQPAYGQPVYGQPVYGQQPTNG